jgi:phytoene synthase
MAELRDRDLVRLYWPAELRPACDALFDIYDAMGDVVTKATEPALGTVKLAWWRERLEELDEGKVPAEPGLQAAAVELLPRGISGADLADLEGGWATLLQEEPDVEDIAVAGAKLFELAASLLGATHALIEPAGRLYAYENVERRRLMTMHWSSDELYQLSTHPFPKALRPLTALTALAARDAKRGTQVEPEATPGRALALIRHRVSGRLPRP